jgi:hypothetical protein
VTLATFAECARAIHASGLDPISRTMLLAVLCDGLPVDAERMAWAGSVGTLAAAAGAGVTAVKARLGALTQAGAVTSERIAGAPVYMFALKAIGRETTNVGRETAASGREATNVGRVATDSLRLATDGDSLTGAGREATNIGREATDPSRVATNAEDGTALAIHAHVGAQDSLLGSYEEPLYLACRGSEVVESVASAPTHTHEAPTPAASTLQAGVDDLQAIIAILADAHPAAFLPSPWVDEVKASAASHGVTATRMAAHGVADWCRDNPRRVPKVAWLAERAEKAAASLTLAPTPAGGGTWRGGRVGGLAGRAEVMADAVEESRATQAARVAWSQTPDGREHAERTAATLREQADNPLLAGM